MEYQLTTWGYMDGDVEVLDCKIHKPTDKIRGINQMIKGSGYYLSRIVPHIIKHPNKKYRLDNISYEEEALLFFLNLHETCNTTDFSNSIEDNKMRTWIEKIVSPIPSLVNTLWMFDYKGISPIIPEDTIPLTHITSYSRPEILSFDKQVYNTFKPQTKKLAIIPCSQGKPYHKRNHKPKEFQKISGKGREVLQQYLYDEEYDKIVLTSLGLIPKEFWMNDVVMSYDTGTRDLWKLLCLCKNFFEKNKYDEYVIIVKFKPYRDIIRLLIDMRVLDKEKVTFIGDDEKSNGLRIMFYPNQYKLYK
jgi:predicted RNA-binding protein